ncbi:hypothetical protein DITRI_Ditri17bG0073900 [Diplodiscus trichospermus]
MEKPDSTSGSGGSSVLNTVFIDTSLDTHLAMIVSDSDTVSDLKKKILYEHPLCFPNMGEIKINALKVKRKGYNYHLSDSMFVKSAFEGIRKSWFLSADASSAEDRENHNSHKPDAGNVAACFGIRTNNSSAVVVDLLPGDTCKRLSDTNGASLPEDGNNCHAKQNSASQQFGFSHSKENSEDLLVEVEHTADSNSKVLFPSNNRESMPKIQEKAVADNQVREDLSASLGASVLKDKRKIRKRNKDAIHDHDVKENDALVVESGKDGLDSDNVLQENLFQNGRSAVCNNMNLVGKTSRSLSSDINKRSASRKRMADEVTKVSGECSECETDKYKDVSVGEQEYKLTENSSRSGPASKKKHKAEKKDGNENSLMESGDLISDSVKQGTGPDATTSDLGQKLESTSTIFDHLNAEPVKENRLLAGIASGGRKKRKKQKSNPSQVGSEISTVEGVNVNNFQAVEAINHKDLGSEADKGVVLGKIYVGEATSEPCLISSMEMQEGSKTSRVAYSGVGDDDMADTNEAHEPDVASVIKTRDSIDQNANRVEGNPTLVAQEAIGLQNDIEVSGHENQSGTLEDKIVKPKKSAKKIKKTKKKKDLVGGQEAVDELRGRGPTSDIPPAEHPTSDTNDGNMERKNGGHEPDVASIIKTRDSIDQNVNHVEGNPTLVTQEAIGLQNDIGITGYENQSGTFEDEIVEPKKSAKKIKKTKKKKDVVGGQEAVDELRDRGPTSDIPPAERPISDTNDGNMERKNEAHEPDVASVIKTGDSIDRNADHVGGNPTLVPKEAIGLQNDIGISGYENQSGTLADKIVEPKKSAKKIKKTKTKKDLVGGQEAVDEVRDRGPANDIPPAELPTSVSGDHLRDNAELDGTTDVRADDVIRDVLESLQQCNNGPTNVEIMDKKSGEKTKRKRSTVVEPSQLQGKDDVDHRDTTVPANNVSEVSASSKSTRKTAKVNSSSAAQLNRSDFRSKNNKGTGLSPNQTQLDFSQYILKSDHEGRPIQDVVNVDHPKSTRIDDADNSIEVPCESESIKSQHRHGVVDSGEISVDKMTNKKVVESQVKDKKKPDVQSGRSRPNLQSSQMLNGNQHKEAKVQAAISSSIQSQRSPSSVEPLDSNVESSKTSLTFSGSAAKELLQSNKSDKIISIPKEAQMPIDINSSRAHTHAEKNNAHAVSRSTLERSKNSININKGRNERGSYPDIAKATGSNNSSNLNKGGSEHRSHLDIAKATGSNNGKVVNSLANKKSLLATAGTIFKHDDKESSDDEDGVDDSDSGTRTPSDSSSSDDSDDSDMNVSSSRNGSYNSEGEEGGGRNRKKTGTSSPKSISLHAILRNSSSYKKAKLTASQDLDSQPDEFVPDSQAP